MNTMSGSTTNIMQNDAQEIPRRLIVVGVVYDPTGALLICRMPANRGVYPGQWGLPGGGVEAGERIEDALRRELREEVGLTVENLKPCWFSEVIKEKLRPGEPAALLHMVFLIYRCEVSTVCPHMELNGEFEEYEWVSHDQLPDYELNDATRETLKAISAMGFSQPARDLQL